LMALLESELGDRLSADQIVFLAHEVQMQAQQQLAERRIA